MLGQLSLFRLWGQEHSEQEVTSLNCTEGDLVKWEGDNWDTHMCAPLPDSTLQCGEPIKIYLFWDTFSLIIPTKVNLHCFTLLNLPF